MFVIGTDTFLLSPLLPLLQNQFHVSTDLSGWMVSAYALGYALFAIIAGPISDRLNRKTVMLWGLAGFIVSTFLCGIAPSFAAMCLFRFAAGISAAFVTPQIWASIPVIVQPSQIIKGMGIATAGLAASQMLGLPFGGFLASFTWHTPFFVLSACSLIAENIGHSACLFSVSNRKLRIVQLSGYLAFRGLSFNRVTNWRSYACTRTGKYAREPYRQPGFRKAGHV